MLLYTKIAAPKAPKRRSRAGCTYCKEKKKKCDETRPQCSRCIERGQECAYEAVKPRQRPRKRDSDLGQTFDGRFPDPFSTIDSTVNLSRGRRRESRNGSLGRDLMDEPQFDSLHSPLDSTWGVPAVDDSLMSPLDVSFHLSSNDGPGGDDDMDNADDDDAEEEIPRADPVHQMAVTRTRHYPDLAMISPAPLPSPHLEFVSPAFSEFSDCANRRSLVDHFANVLSHLIVLRESESGNPFQHLVLPLCYSSTTVQNAIYALSSAHLEHRSSRKSEEKSLYFHNQAIQGLARLIEMGPAADREELLAAIMLLVYFEVLVQRGRSNIVDGHLKGAMTIMTQNNHKSTPTSAFLERAFRFYDVIAALSFGKAPISTAPAAGCLQPVSAVSPLETSDVSSLSSVDTLLGLSTTLWPILHRLSNLLSLKGELEAALAAPEHNVAKQAVLRTEFQTTSDAIETALENWQPSLPHGVTLEELNDYEDVEILDSGEAPRESPERAHLQSILHNALAYRHSAFVHLYRTIHGYARLHPMVQRHTHASLTHCVATVSHAGTMAALLWPLFVAACEAVTIQDRELARQAFVAIDRRQGMTNIERGWIIVQEVWRRSDFMDNEGDVLAPPGVADDMRRQFTARPGKHAGDLWRRVSEDMGVTIVFG